MSAITPQILLRAYAAGIFPMAESAEDNALYWVEPEERGIIPLDGLHISRSLRKVVRKQSFEIAIDRDFAAVIASCAAKTADRKSTWINARIRNLYIQLFRIGACHSVECWKGGELVGGLYGVRIGAAFFGESMFSRVPDASKVALVHLVARLNAGGFRLLDAQFVNPHLERLGAIIVAKTDYHRLLEPALAAEADFFAYRADRDAEETLRLAAGGRNNSAELRPARTSGANRTG
ncbi:MAG: leucyl/phenylalanyl-tRNA--protein transferase [Rhizobiales bacterium]|nr:leucyl/phenylalanyl-tRNA--protein transferase [Hyphomicrobiales bacterium]MBI3673693.1 leucyl/phenylalanyl-tRNA--protein transferase [Hyphomicrobiales bacterium]